MKRFSALPLMIAASTAALLGFASPSFANEADDRVETVFKETYVYRTYLKDEPVHAKAKDGVMTLTGTVREEFHKTIAEDTAGSLAGITRVDNQLSTKAEVASDNLDAAIGRKVKVALLLHRNVSYNDTTVTVKDGVVTLTGTASSTAQKDLTTEYAADIDKVLAVHNNMVVVEKAEPAERSIGEKLDDASITAQVRAALATHRSTSSFKTGVSTREGVVTLTGIAKNSAERSLATKLVKDIHGVTDVKNDMTLAPVQAE